MANEISVQMGLRVLKGNLNHQPPQSSFRDDMSGSAGPSPGSIIVTVAGVSIDFSQLTDPGWCKITNQEASGGSSIDIGLYDPELDRFWPIFEVGPGQSCVGKLSYQFGWQEIPASGGTTGTGTGGETTRLMLRARAHECYALVECFSR